MFLDIDKGLKNIMKKVSENPNCMRTGTQPGQADQFAGWNDILEKIQKQLEDYLEFKRMAFPRCVLACLALLAVPKQQILPCGCMRA